LAIVYHSDNLYAARAALLERGWFGENEIETL